MGGRGGDGKFDVCKWSWEGLARVCHGGSREGWIFVHPSSEIIYSLIGREIDNFFYAWLEKE